MKKDLELEALLKQYTAPEIHSEKRDFQIYELSQAVQDMEYLNRHSFIKQLLAQISFISGWVWLVQAGFLFLFFYFVFQGNPPLVDLLLFSLAPGLSLILLYELTKSFRANVWEMEASCRYSLAQIFFWRFCIICGGDFLVLTSALIAYRMAGGLLWEFCFYTLLPFFLTGALSLYILRRIGNRFHSAVTIAIPLFTSFFSFRFTGSVRYSFTAKEFPFHGYVSAATVLALLLFLYNAFRLCTKQHYLDENRKDRNIWNFD